MLLGSLEDVDEAKSVTVSRRFLLLASILEIFICSSTREVNVRKEYQVSTQALQGWNQAGWSTPWLECETTQ